MCRRILESRVIYFSEFHLRNESRNAACDGADNASLFSAPHASLAPPTPPQLKEGLSALMHHPTFLATLVGKGSSSGSGGSSTTQNNPNDNKSNNANAKMAEATDTLAGPSCVSGVGSSGAGTRQHKMIAAEDGEDRLKIPPVGTMGIGGDNGGGGGAGGGGCCPGRSQGGRGNFGEHLPRSEEACA